jgi:hypothetical protein
MTSAVSMQARLFTLYDAASAVPEALDLVQRQLRITLERTWYSPEEIGRLADEFDRLLAPAGAGPEAAEPDRACAVS